VPPTATISNNSVNVSACSGGEGKCAEIQMGR
jgi:hypothetical protein